MTKQPTSDPPSEGKSGSGFELHISRRTAATITTILASLIVVLTLVGRPDVATQDYKVEIDFEGENPSFNISTSVQNIFIEKLAYPVGWVNLTAHPESDSFWSFSVTTQVPRAMIIENQSGTTVTNFTRIASVGLRIWDYFAVDGSFYWLNMSTYQADMIASVQSFDRFAVPLLNVTSKAGPRSGDIRVVATILPAGLVNKVYLSGQDLTLQSESGPQVNLSGQTRLTFTKFDAAYFYLSTSQSSTILQPGTDLVWFDGPIIADDTSGVITAANGDQRKFQNATIVTMETPRKVRLEVASVPDDYYRIVLRLELDSTVVRVTDGTGVSIVGSEAHDLVVVDWWPGDLFSFALILVFIAGIVLLSWLGPETGQ